MKSGVGMRVETLDKTINAILGSKEYQSTIGKERQKRVREANKRIYSYGRKRKPR